MPVDPPSSTPSRLARLFVAIQYLLPHRAICALVYWAARWRFPPAKNLLIGVFLRLYRLNMGEAKAESPRQYESFNALFTRELKADARPLAGDANTLVCPADGRLTEYGRLSAGRLVQAKGQDYRVGDLLGDAGQTEVFSSGEFATIYLAPHNYHRVHMPTAGRLTRMTLIPGRRFSVNQVTAALVPGLFARNERVVCRFDTPAGPLAVVLVGALNVASISTPWHGEVTGPRGQVTHWDYGQPEGQLRRGAELGQFNLGSTVILVAGNGTLRWDPALVPSMEVRMGQALGTLTTAADTR